MLTVHEVAAQLRVHPRTVYRWIKLKKLQACRVQGGGLRIRPADLDRALGQ